MPKTRPLVKKAKLLLAACCLLIPFLAHPVPASSAESVSAHGAPSVNRAAIAAEPADNLCSNEWQDGSAAHPYLICTPEQMQRLHEAPDAHHVLRTDVDMAGIDWVPVPVFSGTLDGGGHTIANLNAQIGLFDVIGHSGTVKRLHLAGASVYSYSVGGMLAGVNRGTITQVEAAGTVSGRWTLGGLVGTNEGTIRHSRVQGTVSGDTGLGGIAGVNAADGIIRDSRADTLISGSYYTGGITGTNNGLIRHARAEGTICASAGASGGIAGYNDGTITRSSSFNDIHYAAPFAYSTHLIAGLDYGIVTFTTGHGTLHETP